MIKDLYEIIGCQEFLDSLKRHIAAFLCVYYEEHSIRSWNAFVPF